MYVEYSMLYSNKDLLDKYEKQIPSIWEEVAFVAEEIIIKELNDKNEIIGYTSDMSGN